MDQNAFRTILTKPGQVTSRAPTARPKNLITGESSKATKAPTSQPATFKPRKLKDAPKLASSTVERSDDKAALDEIQRLVDNLRSGEPSSATGPVASEDLDATLESAFHSTGSAPADSSPPPVAGKKRTREDIIRELREKKGGAGESSSAGLIREGGGAAAAPKGFKPIGKKVEGFKPIGEKKRKKKKPEEGAPSDAAATERPADSSAPPPPRTEDLPTPLPILEPEADMEEDIFAGAGMFEGYDLGSDEEGETGEIAHVRPPESAAEEGAIVAPAPVRTNWFNEPSSSPSPPPTTAVRPPTPPPAPAGEEGEEEEEHERLQPLESSAVPSIRDLLSMDKEEESRAKRKAKKDAWRAKQGLGASNRDDADGYSDDEERGKKKRKKGLESDYQALKTYMG